MNKKLLEAIEQLRPIDDDFFEKLVEEKEVCEEILSVILQDEQLVVEKVTPQCSQNNECRRSVTLDVLCKLSDGRLCNVEVQRAKRHDDVRRVRFHMSCITVNNTKPQTEFKNIPEIIIVYITEYDVFKAGKTIYRCDLVVRETKDVVDEGVERIFVNTACDDGSLIAALMKCFLQTRVDDERFPRLSERVRHFKEDEGGREEMCEVIEKYGDEREKKGREAEKKANEKTMSEGIKRLFAKGMSVEDVVDSFLGIPRDFVEKLYNEFMNIPM